MSAAEPARTTTITEYEAGQWHRRTRPGSLPWCSCTAYRWCPAAGTALAFVQRFAPAHRAEAEYTSQEMRPRRPHEEGTSAGHLSYSQFIAYRSG